MISEILTNEEEVECEIRIKVRTNRWGFNNEYWGIQIDNTITPLFCCYCNRQLEYFYKLDGSRYGQVGTVCCDCGAKIVEYGKGERLCLELPVQFNRPLGQCTLCNRCR